MVTIGRSFDPGLRDRRILVQQLTETAEATSGAPQETWTPLCQMWARRTDAGDTERFTAQQIVAQVQTVWEVNYRADLDPELVDVAKRRRIIANGQIHDIVQAAQAERRDVLLLATIASSRVTS